MPCSHIRLFLFGVKGATEFYEDDWTVWCLGTYLDFSGLGLFTQSCCHRVESYVQIIICNQLGIICHKLIFLFFCFAVTIDFVALGGNMTLKH